MASIVMLQSHLLRRHLTSRFTTRTFTSTATRRAEYTHAVIGDGSVVGRAIAWKLAQRAGSTILLEKKGSGGDVALRSPNVNLLCPPEWQRHKLHVRGIKLLEEYCNSHKLSPFQENTWIIAQKEDGQYLQPIRAQLCRNGISAQTVDKKDPSRNELPQSLEILEVSALSPVTHLYKFSESLLSGIREAGNDTSLDIEVTAISPHAWSGNYVLTTFDHKTYQSSSIEALKVINAAGLGSQDISNMLNPEKESLKKEFVKASWFESDGPALGVMGRDGVQEVILLCPHDASNLGEAITVRRDEREQFIVGPVRTVTDDRFDTTVDVSQDRIDKLVERLKALFPQIESSDLGPFCAIVKERELWSGMDSTLPSESVVDSCSISGEEGCEGVVKVEGVESGDVRGSLAVAERVEEILYPDIADEGGQVAKKKGWFGLW